MKKLISTITMLLIFSICIAQQTVKLEIGLNTDLAFDTNISKSKHEIKEIAKSTGVRVEMSLYMDTYDEYDEKYTITIRNATSKQEITIATSNKFTLFLNYDREYVVTVNHPDYISKQISINTTCPYDSWLLITGVDLKKGKGKLINAGKIAYNSKLNTFKALVTR